MRFILLQLQQSIKNVLRDGLIYVIYRGVVISVDPNAKITNKLSYAAEAIFDRTGNVFKVRNPNVENFIRKFILSGKEAVFTIRSQEDYVGVIDTINEMVESIDAFQKAYDAGLK